MNLDGPVVIVGFMGSGKTTIAVSLARLLGCQMFDLDEVIADVVGRTPKQIIELDGEAAFRNTETEVLKETLRGELKQVIATGGGVWTLERNRSLIEDHNGISIWLNAPFDLCWKRILAQGDQRPLATTEKSARALFDKRKALYQLAALHVEIDEHNPPAEVAARILQAIPTSSREVPRP